MKSVEQRLHELENKVKTLSEIIATNDLDFIPLSKAAKKLKCNPWVIRDRIKRDDKLILGTHFLKNGSRYLINCSEWQKLIFSEVQAKRQ